MVSPEDITLFSAVDRTRSRASLSDFWTRETNYRTLLRASLSFSADCNSRAGKRSSTQDVGWATIHLRSPD